MAKLTNEEQEAAVAAAVKQIFEEAGIDSPFETMQPQSEEDRRTAARKAKARQIVMPTAGEDADITAAARLDEDNQPLTDEELAQFKPARRGRGRPAKDVTKVQVTLRIDAAVLDSFKAMGEGWQTRMNAALREYAESNNLSKRYAQAV